MPAIKVELCYVVNVVIVCIWDFDWSLSLCEYCRCGGREVGVE